MIGSPDFNRAMTILKWKPRGPGLTQLIRMGVDMNNMVCKHCGAAVKWSMAGAIHKKDGYGYCDPKKPRTSKVAEIRTAA